MNLYEYLYKNQLPPQPRLPIKGEYRVIKTDDGSIYVDPDIPPSMDIHDETRRRFGIPKHRIIGGGFIRDGVYDDGGFRDGSAKIGEQAREEERIKHKKWVEWAVREGKPVPPKVLREYRYPTHLEEDCQREAWTMTSREYMQARFLPPPQEMGNTGDVFHAVRVDDGSVYFTRSDSHLQAAVNMGIPLERIQGSGWVREGRYEEIVARTSLDRKVEQARVDRQAKHRREVLKAIKEGKPVPFYVREEYIK